MARKVDLRVVTVEPEPEPDDGAAPGDLVARALLDTLVSTGLDILRRCRGANGMEDAVFSDGDILLLREAVAAAKYREDREKGRPAQEVREIRANVTYEQMLEKILKIREGGKD
jgi:hypothetical protein